MYVWNQHKILISIDDGTVYEMKHFFHLKDDWY